MEEIIISKTNIRKLLSSGNADCAMLYLSRLGAFGDSATCLSNARLARADSTLKKLGLSEAAPEAGRMSSASERDSESAAESGAFLRFTKEVQRCFRRNLNSEERDILAAIHNKLHISTDVLNVLVHYCVEAERMQNPEADVTMHAVEAEANHWAEMKIDTLEKAAEFIQVKKKDSSRQKEIFKLMGITGRRITEREIQYIQAWCDMGFPNEAIALAFQKTCENTGGLTWKYMSAILERWHNAGLHTVQQIQECDHKPTKELYKRKNGYIKHDDPPTPGMVEAARQMLEDQEF